jgi:hypothetical protein
VAEAVGGCGCVQLVQKTGTRQLDLMHFSKKTAGPYAYFKTPIFFQAGPYGLVFMFSGFFVAHKSAPLSTHNLQKGIKKMDLLDLSRTLRCVESKVRESAFFDLLRSRP